MTTTMRDALTARLFAALKHRGVTAGDILPAVDAALETSGYAELAALATQSVALQAIVADEVGAPHARARGRAGGDGDRSRLRRRQPRQRLPRRAPLA